MPKLILECPACSTRFRLRRYEPEHRVRCRKCQAIVEVPVVPELLTPEDRAKYVEKPIDPAMQAKVVKVLSIKKLGILAILLAFAVAGATALLYKRATAPRIVEKPPKPPVMFDAKRLAATNPVLEYPMGLGWEWVYAAGPEAEERRVTAESRGPNGEPQFELQISGYGAGVTRQLIRFMESGAFIVDETRNGARYSYNPPLPVARFPMMGGDTWTYSGEMARDGGSVEKVELLYQISIEKLDKLAIGKLLTLKMEISGMRGQTRVAEKLWFGKGKGIVQRETQLADRVEAATITRLAQK
jgi:hypothetical protein